MPPLPFICPISPIKSCILPFWLNFFAILNAISNCFTMRLISATSSPAPCAIRLRLQPLSKSGFSRSFFVIELTIARIFFSSLELFKSTFFSCPATWESPGIIDTSELIEPSFLTFSICARKSSKPNCPFLSFLLIFFASFSSMIVAVFSAREMMSPAPISLETMRSG